jgi:hypothetical protein
LLFADAEPRARQDDRDGHARSQGGEGAGRRVVLDKACLLG